MDLEAPMIFLQDLKAPIEETKDKFIMVVSIFPLLTIFFMFSS